MKPRKVRSQLPLQKLKQQKSNCSEMKFTEAQLESAIIELLGVEGYPHVLGEAIMRLVSDGNHLTRERTLTPSPSPKGRGGSDTKDSSNPDSDRDKYHDIVSRFGIIQTLHGPIATAIKRVREMSCSRNLFREHIVTARPSTA